MKKNILITFLLITTVFSFVYSFIKADEAVKSANEALSAQKEADRLRDEAVSIAERAQEAAAEARMQEMRAQKALADCQNK